MKVKVFLILLGCLPFVNSTAQPLVGKAIQEVAKQYDSYYVYKLSSNNLKRAILLKKVSENEVMFTYIYVDTSNVIKIQLQQPYAFVDQMYNEVDTTITSSESDFSEGYAAIRDEGKGLVGFIDIHGSIAIAPEYTKVGKFSDGLAFFAILERCVGGETRPNRMGYIDKSNKKIIVLPKELSELSGCCYLHGGAFRNGIAIMTTKEFGFDCASSAIIVIDRSGRIINSEGSVY
jgi:hypothetical protein